MAVCENCGGEGWVCENHPHVAWKGGKATCCSDEGKPWPCGAGAPCKVCNGEGEPEMPPGFVVTADADGSRH